MLFLQILGMTASPSGHSTTKLTQQTLETTVAELLKGIRGLQALFNARLVTVADQSEV
jgi:hypothetical protein